MGESEKTTRQITVMLVEAGVDADLLQDLLDQAGQTIPIKELILTATSRQIDYAAAFSDEEVEREGIPPSTFMKHDWRPDPKKKTVELIIAAADSPDFDRIAVGYLREDFIRIEGRAQRQHRYWDFAFIQYALKQLEKRTKAAAQPEQSIVTQGRIFTADELEENLARLKTIIDALVEKFSVGHLFRRKLDGQWQARSWVYKKLAVLGVKRDFIYNDARRLCFVAWANRQNKLRENYDYIFFKSVLTEWRQFRKHHLDLRDKIKGSKEDGRKFISPKT